MAALIPERLPAGFNDILFHRHEDPIEYIDQNGDIQAAPKDEPAFEWIDGEFQGLKLFVPVSGSDNFLWLRNSRGFYNPEQGFIVTRYKGVAGDLPLTLMLASGSVPAGGEVPVVEGWKTYVISWKNLPRDLLDENYIARLGSSSDLNGAPRYNKGLYVSGGRIEDDPDLLLMQQLNLFVNSGDW